MPRRYSEPVDDIVSFALAWFLLAIPIGPNAIISIDSSIRYGWPRAVFVPLGIVGAALVYGTLSLTVLAFVLAQMPILFKIAIVLGSIYLFYLGYRILTRPALATADVPPHRSDRQLVVLGFSTSMSNPKAALVYLSVLPGVAHNSTMSPLTIIAITSAIAGFVYCSYSLFANYVRRFVIGSSGRQKFLDGLACLSFWFIAAKNIHDVIKPAVAGSLIASAIASELGKG